MGSPLTEKEINATKKSADSLLEKLSIANQLPTSCGTAVKQLDILTTEVQRESCSSESNSKT